MSTTSVFSLRESFIVRIWRDQDNEASWRGQLQHVRSGNTIPIADVNDIPAELAAYLKKIDQKNRSTQKEF